MLLILLILFTLSTTTNPFFFHNQHPVQNEGFLIRISKLYVDVVNFVKLFVPNRLIEDGELVYHYQYGRLPQYPVAHENLWHPYIYYVEENPPFAKFNLIHASIKMIKTFETYYTRVEMNAEFLKRADLLFSEILTKNLKYEYNVLSLRHRDSQVVFTSLEYFHRILESINSYIHNFFGKVESEIERDNMMREHYTEFQIIILNIIEPIADSINLLSDHFGYFLSNFIEIDQVSGVGISRDIQNRIKYILSDIFNIYDDMYRLVYSFFGVERDTISIHIQDILGRNISEIKDSYHQLEVNLSNFGNLLLFINKPMNIANNFSITYPIHPQKVFQLLIGLNSRENFIKLLNDSRYSYMSVWIKDFEKVPSDQILHIYHDYLWHFIKEGGIGIEYFLRDIFKIENIKEIVAEEISLILQDNLREHIDQILQVLLTANKEDIGPYAWRIWLVLNMLNTEAFYPHQKRLLLNYRALSNSPRNPRNVEWSLLHKKLLPTDTRVFMVFYIHKLLYILNPILIRILFPNIIYENYANNIEEKLYRHHEDIDDARINKKYGQIDINNTFHSDQMRISPASTDIFRNDKYELINLSNEPDIANQWNNPFFYSTLNYQRIDSVLYKQLLLQCFYNQHSYHHYLNWTIDGRSVINFHKLRRDRKMPHIPPPRQYSRRDPVVDQIDEDIVEFKDYLEIHLPIGINDLLSLNSINICDPNKYVLQFITNIRNLPPFLRREILLNKKWQEKWMQLSIFIIEKCFSRQMYKSFDKLDIVKLSTSSPDSAIFLLLNIVDLFFKEDNRSYPSIMIHLPFKMTEYLDTSYHRDYESRTMKHSDHLHKVRWPLYKKNIEIIKYSDVYGEIMNKEFDLRPIQFFNKDKEDNFLDINILNPIFHNYFDKLCSSFSLPDDGKMISPSHLMYQWISHFSKLFGERHTIRDTLLVMGNTEEIDHFMERFKEIVNLNRPSTSNIFKVVQESVLNFVDNYKEMDKTIVDVGHSKLLEKKKTSLFKKKKIEFPVAMREFLMKKLQFSNIRKISIREVMSLLFKPGFISILNSFGNNYQLIIQNFLTPKYAEGIYDLDKGGIFDRILSYYFNEVVEKTSAMDRIDQVENMIDILQEITEKCKEIFKEENLEERNQLIINIESTIEKIEPNEDIYDVVFTCIEHIKTFIKYVGEHAQDFYPGEDQEKMIESGEEEIFKIIQIVKNRRDIKDKIQDFLNLNKQLLFKYDDIKRKSVLKRNIKIDDAGVEFGDRPIYQLNSTELYYLFSPENEDSIVNQFKVFFSRLIPLSFLNLNYSGGFPSLHLWNYSYVLCYYKVMRSYKETKILGTRNFLKEVYLFRFREDYSANESLEYLIRFYDKWMEYVNIMLSE